MKQSIILEGPNGSGKSTLGKRLSDVYQMAYLHAGPSPGDSTKAVEACCDQLNLLQDGVILDRITPISRPIYEIPLSLFEQDLHKTFQEIMLEYAVVVYCVGEGPFKEKSYYPEGHYEQVMRDRQDIRDRYDAYMENVPHIRYDWNEHGAWPKITERIRDARL